jgi:aryl-alcohol dehydrogenase-like predicted oxidoreductase
MMDGLAECVKSGKARTVGVSNFNQSQMLAAYSGLARHNIPLASNQLHYSLLHRAVEKNGTLARCQELGIRLIAYSPLEMGLLTGKYSIDAPPPGTRGRMYTNLLPRIGPLLKLMTEIGQHRGGKSNVQVALNWVICKGALPIPGAKNVKQAQENAGGLGWKLSEAEVAKLDEISDNILKS